MTNMLLSDAIRLTTGESFLVFAIGFVLTMLVLAFLIGVICVMRWVLQKLKKQPENDEKALAAKAVCDEKKKANGSCGDMCLNNVSEREAAMVMAIVADGMQTPLNELRFKSIKCIGEEK